MRALYAAGPMLDLRVYRVAFIPAILALALAAFSLADRPRGATTVLSPDAFDGARALRELNRLARGFPERAPGGAGDQALADRVARDFRAARMTVDERSFEASTEVGRRTLTTVVGRRQGVSARQIVVLAHRDARAGPSTAALSGTAALLELARVFRGRKLRQTLVLVSTSGGSAGNAGAAEFARDPDGSVEAVIVAGDIAGRGVRKPIVVPWSQWFGVAPLELRRTVEAALREETRIDSEAVSAPIQFLRLAMPLSLGEQGVVDARDIPSVLVQASGEQGPGDERAVSPERLEEFGRGLMRSVTALDTGGDNADGDRDYLIVQRKLLPAWAVQAVIAALILPALLLAIDAMARGRRRGYRVGEAVAWVLAGVLPFLAVAGVLLALAMLGVLSLPPAPVEGGAIAFEAGRIAIVAAVLLALVGAWLGLRRLAIRALDLRARPTEPDTGAALSLVLALVAVVACVLNPFAAALLLPALHLWPFATATETAPPRWLGATLLAVGLVPAVLVAIYYAAQFGLGPLELLWTGVTVVGGGALPVIWVVLWCVVLGCVAGAIASVRARTGARTAEGDLRAAPSYAGPGSLGGTESALRR